jgi:hypothetical protein
VLALALWNAFYMPFDFAFEIDKESEIFAQIDFTVDVFFCVDLVLMFFTSYVSRQGLEIKTSLDIALNYIKQPRFYSDSLSLLGTEVVSDHIPSLRILGILKVVRVLRLNQFIRNLKIGKETRQLLTLVKYIFFIYLWLHITGCFYWPIL